MDFKQFSKSFNLVNSVAVGISVGYLVYKAIDDKTNDLVREGGSLNAFALGYGQGALAATVGMAAFLVWNYVTQ